MWLSGTQVYGKRKLVYQKVQCCQRGLNDGEKAPRMGAWARCQEQAEASTWQHHGPGHSTAEQALSGDPESPSLGGVRHIHHFCLLGLKLSKKKIRNISIQSDYIDTQSVNM